MKGKLVLKGVAGLFIAVVVSVAALAAAEPDLRVLDAARNQDADAVRALLSAGADVSGAQADGATALHWTAHWNDLQMADALLGAGADVNEANDYGVTPLSQATENRSLPMVEKLLMAGADPNATLWTGETPLMTAVASGNLEVVKALLAYEANVNASEPRRGQTALMWAIANGHPAVARVLIESGANGSARTHQLIEENFTPMVVGGYGEDFQATSKGGLTPLLFAARHGDLETAKLLVESGADVNESSVEYGTPLVMATAEGFEELALYLLEQGADPNATDQSGITPLHYALRDGLKLMHGVNITQAFRVCQSGAGARCIVVDDPADIPPELAASADILSVSEMYQRNPNNVLPGNNMSGLARALLTAGADPNAQLQVAPPRFRLRLKPTVNLTGATPFLLATAAADIPLMRMLVEGGAKPLIGTVIDEREFYKEGFGDDNQIQGNGTPLMAAAGMGRRDGYSKSEEARSLEALKTLVQLGGNVNDATETGWTPLHAAAYLGADSIIEYLVATGADVNARNGCGQTAWSLAAGTDARGLLARVTPHRKTADLLLELGAVMKPDTEPAGRCVEGRFGLEYATVNAGDRPDGVPAADQEKDEQEQQ